MLAIHKQRCAIEFFCAMQYTTLIVAKHLIHKEMRSFRTNMLIIAAAKTCTFTAASRTMMRASSIFTGSLCTGRHMSYDVVRLALLQIVRASSGPPFVWHSPQCSYKTRRRVTVPHTRDSLKSHPQKLIRGVICNAYLTKRKETSHFHSFGLARCHQ